MNEAEVLNDLRQQFPHLNGKIYLKPVDLVPIFGISEGQQANLRSEGRFRIPLQDRKLGFGVCVSIYNLAKFITEGENAFGEPKISKARKVKIMAFWSEVNSLIHEREAVRQHQILDSEIPPANAGVKRSGIEDGL